MEIVEERSRIKKEPSVLRTFRISSELDRALTRNAAQKKIGKNALLVSIFNKYLEWHSVVEDFGYLSVPRQMVTSLIEGLDKESVSFVARLVGKEVASSLPVWFGSADLDSLLKYLDTSVRYSGANVQHRVEKLGKLTRIVIYQPFNEKGAAWVRGFNTGLIENALGYPPKIVEHANSIEIIIESKESE